MKASALARPLTLVFALGVQKVDPTLAEVLKTQGYATAQFGKNHLGDRNEFLPIVHGFDYWFGNLYHLNAEEEPEELDYPGRKDPARGASQEFAGLPAKPGVGHAQHEESDRRCDEENGEPRCEQQLKLNER
jgi:arylsulfatase A-like enzyme